MVFDSRTFGYLTALNADEFWRETLRDARMFASDGREPAAPLRIWLEAVGNEDALPLIPDDDSTRSWVPEDVEGVAAIGSADLSVLFVDPEVVFSGTAETVRYGRAVQRFAAERWPQPGCIFMQANEKAAVALLEETDTAFLKHVLVLSDPEITVAHIVTLIAATDLSLMPYAEYLKTAHWQSVRRDAAARAKNRCQLCNSRKKPLDTHHRTYERRGFEAPEDVIVLCRTCHGKFHDKLPKGGE